MENQPLNPPPPQGNRSPPIWRILKGLLIYGLPFISACLFCVFAYKVLAESSNSTRRQEVEEVSPIFKEYLSRELTDISAIDLLFTVMGNSVTQTCKFIIMTPSYNHATLNIRSMGTQIALYEDFSETLTMFNHAVGVVYLNIESTIQPVIILWLSDDAPIDMKAMYRTKYNPLIMSRIPLGAVIFEVNKPEQLEIDTVMQKVLKSIYTRNILPAAWVYNGCYAPPLANVNNISSSLIGLNNTVANVSVLIDDELNATQTQTQTQQSEFELTEGNSTNNNNNTGNTTSDEDAIKTVVQDIYFFLNEMEAKLLIVEPGIRGFETPNIALGNKTVDSLIKFTDLLSGYNNLCVVAGYNFEYEDQVQPIILIWKPLMVGNDTIKANQLYNLTKDFKDEDLPVMIVHNSNYITRFSLLEVAVQDYSRGNITEKRYGEHNDQVLNYLKLAWGLE